MSSESGCNFSQTACYVWATGPWGACSATCGSETGTETSVLRCVQTCGSPDVFDCVSFPPIDPINCLLQTVPATTQSCTASTVACPTPAPTPAPAPSTARPATTSSSSLPAGAQTSSWTSTSLIPVVLPPAPSLQASQGSSSSSTLQLWPIIVGACAAVMVIVIGCIAYGLYRASKRASFQAPQRKPSEVSDGKPARKVSVAWSETTDETFVRMDSAEAGSHEPPEAPTSPLRSASGKEQQSKSRPHSGAERQAKATPAATTPTEHQQHHSPHSPGKADAAHRRAKTEPQPADGGTQAKTAWQHFEESSKHGRKTEPARGRRPEEAERTDPPRAQTPPPRKPPDNNEAAKDAPAAAAFNVITKIDAELDAMRGKDLEWRRKHFKALLLQWHPDKNHEEPHAAEVFRHLMGRRGNFLEA